MPLASFETQVPGKWILAGEHSVLRGCPALVFPLESRSLSLAYQDKVSQGLTLELAGDHGEELQLLVWGVLEKACQLSKVSRADLRGVLRAHSSIPVGAGLGASAALCVGIAQWFLAMKLITTNQLYEFARTLENLFHGESSGVDIAVALSRSPLRFSRSGERASIEVRWQPHCYVSYSGKRGVTLECVNKVKSLLESNPKLGERIDQDMAQAVNLAQQALSSEEIQGLPLLKSSMDLAYTCFERWGLCVESHVEWLRQQGALAIKPTGSGGGGYVLSLWEKEPPLEVRKLLIPCFESGAKPAINSSQYLASE
ncbi:MAG: hypothetical protein COT73_10620 [Bdellovibrio sp. CG10_big_fil_rev_8_21_14_0_10_47_8]|nr:MAG: hypothetical protein COT73_10620 [Bdellovibrio sp. CG10_big_fil_rev_8_21_14_0_10_47_8]